MKRSIFFILLIISTFTIFSGCSRSSGGSTDASTEDSSDSTENSGNNTGGSTDASTEDSSDSTENSGNNTGGATENPGDNNDTAKEERRVDVMRKAVVENSYNLHF